MLSDGKKHGRQDERVVLSVLNMKMRKPLCIFFLSFDFCKLVFYRVNGKTILSQTLSMMFHFSFEWLFVYGLCTLSAEKVDSAKHVC